MGKKKEIKQWEKYMLRGVRTPYMVVEIFGHFLYPTPRPTFEQKSSEGKETIPERNALNA